jgi:drug/metabolite transporter (DMT)-like permease
MTSPVTASRVWLVLLLTCLTITAFAANSLLTRLAFQTTRIDAASFTAVRIVSGAATLWLIALAGRQPLKVGRAGWLSALLLFVYAAAFSFAYRHISTGAGALVLFAAAQLLMIACGLLRGERTSMTGLMVALGGLVLFLSPGAAAPPLGAAVLMALAGFAWGGFSLLGKRGDSPVAGTALSFMLALPLALLLMAVQHRSLTLDAAGVLYALLSGSLASGVGYALWYWVRVRMAAMTAGAVQLSVPVLSALFGAVFLGEAITVKEAGSALLVLAGIVLVIRRGQR